MSQLTLEITEISAKDLNKVNLITNMHVYALVSISGDKSNQRIKTPVDKDGGREPSWNFTMKFTLDEAALRENRLTLELKLMSERVLGDKEIGLVRVPIKDLLDSSGSGNVMKLRSYQVRKPDGKPKGFIIFSYIFAGKDTKVDAPVMTLPPPDTVVGESSSGALAYAQTNKEGVVYAPPQPAHGAPLAGYPPPPQYAYPPPPPQYAYPYPQQQVYVPQQMYRNYSAPVQQQQPKTSSNLGMGLVGGVIGGMLLEDMFSDSGDYDF